MVESVPAIYCTSQVPRIQRVLDGADRASRPCVYSSNSFVVTYEDVNRRIEDGVHGLTAFLEGPIDGRYYRVESPSDPVIILELDDQLERARMFATNNPRGYLGLDPRHEFVDMRIEERGGPFGAPNAEPPTWDHRHQGAMQDEAEKPSRNGRKKDQQTSPYDGFNFSVGHNKNRKPRKDMMRAMQNRRNARRGLAKRVKASKEWHRSPDGMRLHKALARYNKRNESVDENVGARLIDVFRGERGLRRHWKRTTSGNGRYTYITNPPADALDKARKALKRMGGRKAKEGMTKGVPEPFEVWRVGADEVYLQSGARRLTITYYPNKVVERVLRNWEPYETLIEATADYVETIDDVLDSVMRKLLVMEALDVLQDVEFDDVSGSIYLFFSPMLRADEIDHIMKTIQSQYRELQVVASPDGSLPGEIAPADFWILYLPRTKMEGMMPPAPDPRFYSPEYPDGPPSPGEQIKQQMFVPAPVTSAEDIAQQVNIDKALTAIGAAESVAKLPAKLAEKIAAKFGALSAQRISE